MSRYNSGGDVDWYDFDKKMALINLGQIEEYSLKLDALVNENTELEDWVKMKLTRVEQNIADVKKSLEGWEKYSEGGRIFKKQLLHINKYAKDLIAMIQGGSKLMSWQENKLAISADYIDNLYHHLDYEMGNRASKMESGGAVENLEKELRKLQRELNSSRLSTYTEGDTSEQEMARRNEREVKLARFNEVLRLLRESDSEKYENGGGVSINTLKNQQEKLDEEGNTVVSYDESDDSWLWEDYKTSVVRRGFESEYDAYDNLVGYLEGQYIYFESGGNTGNRYIYVLQEDESEDNQVFRTKSSFKKYLQEFNKNYNTKYKNYQQFNEGEEKQGGYRRLIRIKHPEGFSEGGDIQWDDASWSEQEAFSPYMNREEYENLNWASKTFSKSAEILVRENLQNGEICICKLKKIIGHEPSYPNQVVGGLKLRKVYLRPYYKV
jgi:hypothetical protein